MLEVFCAFVFIGCRSFPRPRSAGSLQHTWTRKVCSEALTSSALSNQITSRPLLPGEDFSAVRKNPLVEYILSFVSSFLPETDFTVKICTPVSTFLFLSFSMSV